MNSNINVAIDGPAGAGKSTVAKLLAAKLSFVYIDTGAMYRALTWKAKEDNVDYHDEVSLTKLLEKMDLELKYEQGGVKIILGGKDITEAVRSPEVTNNVSYVARHARIRDYMVMKQQELAAKGKTVMDGRDIGTAVLPEAAVKFFLTASVQERAERRYLEQTEKGIESDIELLKEEISKRDRLDTERKTAPLKKADDALEIDTTNMSIDEVVERLLTITQEQMEAYE
ncbi:(d)CMP kinase [Alkalicoccus halolimnae]|uniref:Cytidylate kinase n=1 Tax=Alkalicoccus halolimnae TaxID=1667239 RepID=A0A5C7FH36_9BACI|nr:(d)CMP kinase [Alkalicoccus halolimnae]TXF83023.1 (d)CMP kinase [Alkalicoccus halolimnae]